MRVPKLSHHSSSFLYLDWLLNCIHTSCEYSYTSVSPSFPKRFQCNWIMRVRLPSEVLMRLKTCSRHEAETQFPLSNWGMISINTPGSGFPNHKDGWKSIALFYVPDDNTGFDEDDLVRVVKTIQRFVEEKYDGILIHCHMGVSRSVGVAKAISDVYDIPYRAKFSGNATIYRQVYNGLQNITDPTDYNLIFKG